MRGTVLAVGVLCSVLAAATARATEGFRSCEPVRDIGPTGQDPADGWSIRTNATCHVARSVVRRYSRAAGENAEGEPARLGAWTCTDSYPRVRCTRDGGRIIRFRNDG